MKIALIFILAICTIYLYAENSTLKNERIRPRAGECTIQMKSMFEADRWDDVIFVYGYSDDYSVAKYLVDLTDTNEEMRGGRPKGSWRVKVH
jgi:hypothetical protein